MAAKPAFDLTLYLVAGSDVTAGRPLDEVVAAAVRGGVTLVQLREKTRPDAEIVELARALKDLLGPLDVPLIVNDRVEVARAAGADGVHLGQDDLDVARARAILGPGRLIGVSAGTAAEAEAARVHKAAADYVGIGPVYATPTKADAGAPIGVAGFGALAAALAPLPAVAIGGIGAGNAARVMAGGAADGIAVVSAICGAEDPEAAARALRREIAAGREGVAKRN